MEEEVIQKTQTMGVAGIVAMLGDDETGSSNEAHHKLDLLCREFSALQKILDEANELGGLFDCRDMAEDLFGVFKVLEGLARDGLFHIKIKCPDCYPQDGKEDAFGVCGVYLKDLCHEFQAIEVGLSKYEALGPDFAEGGSESIDYHYFIDYLDRIFRKLVRIRLTYEIETGVLSFGKEA